MGLTAAAAVALAVVLDAAVGEPPTRYHPVAWFGKLVAPFDRDWTNPHAVGVGVALVLPVLAALAVGGATTAAASFAPELAAVVAGLALFTSTSRRMLLREARAVVDGTETDLDAARERLRSLAGRDATDLSPGQVRSAAVESTAENLADGLVAPLLAFAAGAFVSLPVAAGAAAWVKSVNTLDSMLGYREKRVGTASARLDDAVMWLPARVSALLLAVTAFDPAAVLSARTHAGTPSSPNSGWPMATLAAALGVHLQKPGSYDLPLGPAFPSVAESRRGVRVVGTAGLFAAALAVGVVAWS